jgi:hypothetical protein
MFEYVNTLLSVGPIKILVVSIFAGSISLPVLLWFLARKDQKDSQEADGKKRKHG